MSKPTDKPSSEPASSNCGGGSSDEIRFHDIAPMAEFACWVAVALTPFLRWVNGPAVSTDQFVVQVTMFSLALTGGIGLRIYNYRTKGRK